MDRCRNGVNMNEEYKRRAYDYEADDIDLLERQRQRRIARKKRQQRQRRKRRLAMCAGLLLIAAFAVALLPKNTQPLKGTWVYGEMATIQFNSKGRGIIALPEKDTECAFTYTVEENTLQLCFDNTYITDATYTFTVERDNLTLFGGDGTTGGTYALMRVD